MKTIFSNNNNNSIYLKFCFIIITMIVIFIGIFNFNISNNIILAIVSIAICPMKHEELKKITFFLLPMITIIHGYIILFCLLLLLKSRLINKYQIIPPLILITIEFIHILIQGHLNDFSDFIYYSSCIFLFFYILFDNKSKTYTSYISIFCYSLSIVLLIVTYSMITNYGIEAFSGNHRDGSIIGSGIDGENITRVALNANSVGYFSLAAITMLFTGSKMLKIPNVVYIVCYIICILAGIISFSRTWILLVIVSFTLFILLNNFNFKKKIVFTLSITCLLIIFASTEFANNIYDVFYNRFTSEDMETAGNRINILDNYWGYLDENPDAWIWGRGLINSKYINSVTVHNATMQIILSYGIIGILVFVLSFIIYYYKFCPKNITKVQYIPFIACFIMLQTLQFLSPHFLMFPILVSMIALKINNIDINYKY